MPARPPLLPYKQPPHSVRSSSSHIPQAAAGGGGGASGGAGGGKATGGSGGASGGGQPQQPGGLWGAYLRALNASPLLTKGITSALINALGNIFAQLVVEGREGVDTHRLLVFTLIGGLFVAPVLHFWYSVLGRLVPAPGNTGAMLRMATDQLGFAPVFTAAMMSIILSAEGKAGIIGDVLKADWMSTVQANWALWVPVQFLNFRFVPPQLQVLVANAAAFFWSAYVSWVMRPKEAKA